jgi:hypothetical protein
MLERTIEAALGKKVKSLGGKYEKFTSPSRRSVPDRIITLVDGRIIFVECKATGEVATDAQERDHNRRRILGCDVRVISTMEQVDAFPN